MEQQQQLPQQLRIPDLVAQQIKQKNFEEQEEDILPETPKSQITKKNTPNIPQLIIDSTTPPKNLINISNSLVLQCKKNSIELFSPELKKTPQSPQKDLKQSPSIDRQESKKSLKSILSSELRDSDLFRTDSNGIPIVRGCKKHKISFNENIQVHEIPPNSQQLQGIQTTANNQSQLEQNQIQLQFSQQGSPENNNNVIQNEIDELYQMSSSSSSDSDSESKESFEQESQNKNEQPQQNKSKSISQHSIKIQDKGSQKIIVNVPVTQTQIQLQQQLQKEYVEQNQQQQQEQQLQINRKQDKEESTRIQASTNSQIKNSGNIQRNSTQYTVNISPNKKDSSS